MSKQHLDDLDVLHHYNRNLNAQSTKDRAQNTQSQHRKPTMSTRLSRLLYKVTLHPALRDDSSDDSATPQSPTDAPTYRVRRNFVGLRVHVGELGAVKAVTVRFSCGDPAVDKMAVIEVKSKIFPQPRIGHKAVAQWHNMKWDVPAAFITPR